MDSVTIYSGTKLFWRTRLNVELFMQQHKIANAVQVISKMTWRTGCKRVGVGGRYGSNKSQETRSDFQLCCVAQKMRGRYVPPLSTCGRWISSQTFKALSYAAQNVSLSQTAQGPKISALPVASWLDPGSFVVSYQKWQVLVFDTSTHRELGQVWISWNNVVAKIDAKEMKKEVYIFTRTDAGFKQSIFCCSDDQPLHTCVSDDFQFLEFRNKAGAVARA